MAAHWHQGGRWAHAFCQAFDLPEILAQRRGHEHPDDELVRPTKALPPLHDFQLDVYKQLREKLGQGRGGTAMLSLPTGAGKTRVMVEAICDHLADDFERSSRNVVLWIAQSSELQEQAWACFRQVWQVPPEREDGESVIRPCDLRLVRGWGGRRSDDIEIEEEPTILIAGIDQLASWQRRSPEFFERFPQRRLLCVVIDEAHSVITREFRGVLEAMGLVARREWRPLSNAPLVIGLTATPWRGSGDNEETQKLRRYFDHQLVRPESLGERPIRALQKRKILAEVETTSLRITTTRRMTAAQLALYDQFHDLPPDYLREIGADPVRNGRIIAKLAKLPWRSRVLVFACSVEHAEVLALALNKALAADCAAVVTGSTPRPERASVIQRFRAGKLRFLVNVGVLTTGFDAPKVDVVCITRPTTSAVLYEQMVGRGLRGERNGGTKVCKVLDVQDEGLPTEVQSYERVAALWDLRC